MTVWQEVGDITKEGIEKGEQVEINSTTTYEHDIFRWQEAISAARQAKFDVGSIIKIRKS